MGKEEEVVHGIRLNPSQFNLTSQQLGFYKTWEQLRQEYNLPSSPHLFTSAHTPKPFQITDPEALNHVRSWVPGLMQPFIAIASARRRPGTALNNNTLTKLTQHAMALLGFAWNFKKGIQLSDLTPAVFFDRQLTMDMLLLQVTVRHVSPSSLIGWFETWVELVHQVHYLQHPATTPPTNIPTFPLAQTGLVMSQQACTAVYDQVRGAGFPDANLTKVWIGQKGRSGLTCSIHGLAGWLDMCRAIADSKLCERQQPPPPPLPRPA